MRLIAQRVSCSLLLYTFHSFSRNIIKFIGWNNLFACMLVAGTCSLLLPWTVEYGLWALLSCGSAAMLRWWWQRWCRWRFRWWLWWWWLLWVEYGRRNLHFAIDIFSYSLANKYDYYLLKRNCKYVQRPQRGPCTYLHQKYVDIVQSWGINFIN